MTYEERFMTTGKIAIPYYGKLTHPVSGFERVFFIVDHDSQRPIQAQTVSLGIWDARQSPFLPAWLQEIGVQQVVCNSVPDETLLDTMINAGIRVFNEGSETARKLLKHLNIL